MHTTFSLQQELRKLTTLPVVVIITDNAQSMITVKRTAAYLTLRLHKMFLTAPATVIAVLARWLMGEKTDRDLVQEYIDQHRGDITKLRRQKKLFPVGEVYDLTVIAATLNRAYLSDRSRAPLTWGREISCRRPRTTCLGTFDERRGIITISRRLDSCAIPPYVVEYIVFHEMLHEILGVGERADGKRDIHGRTFKLMEQTYPHYRTACEFIKQKWGGE